MQGSTAEITVRIFKCWFRSHSSRKNNRTNRRGCASFVGALASVHKLSWLDSVNFGPHELWVITVTNSKHIVNNLNGYEGINLIQSFRPKLQLPDLVCTFCQNSLLRKQLYTDVFCQSMASGAGRAAQLPTCVFRIQIAKFGLWAGSLPHRGLEPLSSHSEDQNQYLNLSGGFCDVFGW